MTGQFALTDDQLAIQETAQRFTADHITPFAAQWDEDHHFPRDVIQKTGELGFGAIYVSEESGGIALGRLEAALIMEAMAYGCPATSAYVSIHNMASWMIDRFGSQAVKDKYLPSLIGMDKLASLSMPIRLGRYLALTASEPKRSIIQLAMLWIEMKALVEGQP